MTDLAGRALRDVMLRLERPLVEIEASGRHLHLSRADADQLLGPGSPLTPVRQVSQPGQFTCAERIRVVGPKGEFPAFGIIGPERSETQVEVSASDAVILGVDPPVRLSGELDGTPGVTLVGPAGHVMLKRGVIIALRHIHMHPDYGREHGLTDRQVVAVRVWSERGITFDNVVIRMSPDFTTVMHIDYDEANACGFRKGTLGTILV